MHKEQLAKKMATFLTNCAAQAGTSLKGINLVNYQSFLHQKFNDGGRIVQIFENMANECYFGLSKTTKREDRAAECVEDALGLVIEANYVKRRKSVENQDFIYEPYNYMYQ